MNEKFEVNSRDDGMPFRFSVRRLTYAHTRWRREIELLIVLSGRADVRTAEGVRHLKRDDILLVNTGCRREIRSGEGCDIISFLLDPEGLDRGDPGRRSLYFACDSSREPGREAYGNLKALVFSAVRRNLEREPPTSRENRSVAYSILEELRRKFAADPPPELEEQRRALERMEPVAAYVEEHFREGLSLRALAEAVHLTPTYLSSLFTKNLGITFSEYYNGVRLSHAVGALTETDAPIDAVAARNGYANAQAFVRAFKPMYNMLPSVYRRQFGGKDGGGREADRELMGRYFPLNGEGREDPEERLRTEAEARWGRTDGTFDDRFRRLLGIGSAKQILMGPVQEQLEEIQRRIGFRYIKFHGLFSDEMMAVSRQSDGTLRFSFQMADKVFDYLFSIGLRPVLHLSFMPQELARDKDRLIYNHRFNISQPERVEDWCLLVRRFLEHMLARYGRERIGELPVLIWNNADSKPDMFGMEDETVFFRLYRDTFRTVKSLAPEIQVGSPPLTFMNEDSVRWAERFFERLRAEDIRPDFFCSQFYSEVGADPGHLRIDLGESRPDHLYDGREQHEGTSLDAGVPMSPDPDKMRRHIQFLKEFKASAGLEDVPLWITEFNLTFSHRQWLNDTLFAGCYVLKNVLENIDRVDALGYWSATDYIEEQQLDNHIFHGGLGLMTVDGVRKPQFLAYEALGRILPRVLARGEGYLVSASENALVIVTYNYEHFSEIYARNRAYNMTARNRYTPFTKQRRHDFHIRVEGLGRRKVADATEFIVDRAHGSAFDAWVDMGAPRQGVSLDLDRRRLELLKASAFPRARTLPLEAANGVLDYRCTLEPLEFRVTQILFE